MPARRCSPTSTASAGRSRAASTWSCCPRTTRPRSLPRATRRSRPTRSPPPRRRRVVRSQRPRQPAKPQPLGAAVRRHEGRHAANRPPGAAKPGGPGAKPQVVVRVDFDNILQRILAMPMPARRYVDAAGRQGRRAACRRDARAVRRRPSSRVSPSIATTSRRAAATWRWAGSRSFEIARNGEKMLYRQGERWFITALRPMPAPGAPAAPAPSGPPSHRRAVHRLDRGPGRSARRVAADVPRGVAHRARVLLRPASITASTWRRPSSATSPSSRASRRAATSTTCSRRCSAR